MSPLRACLEEPGRTATRRSRLDSLALLSHLKRSLSLEFVQRIIGVRGNAHLDLMTATSVQKLDLVIRQIHSSVGKETGWEDVMAQFCELLHSRSVALAKHDFSTGRGERLYESPDNPTLSTAYAEEHSARNPWFMSSMDYQEGRIMAGEELLDPSDLVRTDFYQRFLKHHGLYHWLCGVLTHHNDVVHYVSIHRAKSQPAFSAHDKKLLARLLEHLKISLHNHWTLLGERGVGNVLREITDRLAQAVFVVDSRGRFLFRNSGSEEFLERHQCLQAVDSRIKAVRDEDDKVLRDSLLEVCARSSSAIKRPEKVITIGGETTPYPLMVSIRAAGRVFCKERSEHHDALILFAKIPGARPSVQTCTFSKFYQLTPAQARLTDLILSGHSLAEAAMQLNVSENTVRSHLKQIYSKTNTHGQMQLVHLHAKLCTDHR